MRWSHVPRSKKAGQWKDWFTPEDCAILQPLFEPYMKHFGYLMDWELSPNPLIKKSENVDYIEQTMLLNTNQRAL